MHEAKLSAVSHHGQHYVVYCCFVDDMKLCADYGWARLTHCDVVSAPLLYEPYSTLMILWP